jgi:uncharacterized membrane protein YqjE
MTSRLLMILVTIAAFGVLTVFALMETGYFGLFEMQMQNFAGLQVLTDLVIVCLLACIWMVRDARERRRLLRPAFLSRHARAEAWRGPRGGSVIR